MGILIKNSFYADNENKQVTILDYGNLTSNFSAIPLHSFSQETITIPKLVESINIDDDYEKIISKPTKLLVCALCIQIFMQGYRPRSIAIIGENKSLFECLKKISHAFHPKNHILIYSGLDIPIFEEDFDIIIFNELNYNTNELILPIALNAVKAKGTLIDIYKESSTIKLQELLKDNPAWIPDEATRILNIVVNKDIKAFFKALKDDTIPLKVLDNDFLLLLEKLLHVDQFNSQELLGMARKLHKYEINVKNAYPNYSTDLKQGLNELKGYVLQIAHGQSLEICTYFANLCKGHIREVFDCAVANVV